MPPPASGEQPMTALDRARDEALDRVPQRTLRRAVGLLGIILLPVSLVWALIGALIQDPALVAVGSVATVYAIWVLAEQRRSVEWPASRLASRMAVAMNATIVAVATAEPLLSTPMAMAALIPAVIALAYVDRRVVAKLMLLGTFAGTYAALAPLFCPWTSNFGMPLDLILPTSTLIVAYAILHIFLWNASGQLTETATELGAAMALSREVAQTLDPAARRGASSPATSPPRPARPTAP